MINIIMYQVYTLLKEDATKLMVVGYCVLNIFVESGTTKQSVKDDIASTVLWMCLYVCMYICIRMYVYICDYKQTAVYSRTLIIRIFIIQTLGYPKAISNFKIPKDRLIFCKPSNKWNACVIFRLVRLIVSWYSV